MSSDLSSYGYDGVIPGVSPFREYAPTYLMIRTKDAEVVPFCPNAAQLRLEQEWEAAQREGRPIRFLILKARQMGFSTWSLGKMYETCTTNFATEALLVAHDDDSTVDLFERVHLMYDLAPDKPRSRYSNRTELDFSNPDRRASRTEPGLLSRIRLGTAGKLNVGRSKTIRYLHCSETAFWRDADKVLLSLTQAVPKGPGTVIIIESTANGMGNEFHRRWLEAINPGTRGDWRALFFPWWEQSEYRIPLDGSEMLPIPSCVDDADAFLAEEREIAGLYRLDREQLNWRRWAIVNNCGNSVEKFRQEYPGSWEEAFLVTGRPVFNRQRLAFRMRALMAEDLDRQAKRKPARYLVGEIGRSGGHAQFVVKERGRLRVYRWPQAGHSYMIGADFSEGVTKGRDPDETAFQVIDRVTWEQVAVWQGQIPAEEAHRELTTLGYYYNTAMIVPESNNHGHTVCLNLREIRYPRLHIREEYEGLGNKIVEKVGWRTDAKTRHVMVDALDGAVNHNDIKINDLPTIQQMMTFVRNEKTGKPEGEGSCKDDLVIAASIACAVMAHGPMVLRQSEPVKMDPSKAEVRMVQQNIRKWAKQAAALAKLQGLAGRSRVA